MSLAEQLTVYLRRTWAVEVAIENLQRIPGGASRETFRFDAVSSAGRRGLILRRDPTAESLIDTDRATEFLAYRTAWDAGLPVPEPLALEADGAELGQPFFLMAQITGGSAVSPFTPLPFGEHATAFGEQMFRTLGRLAAIQPVGTPLGEALTAPGPDCCWEVALDHWAEVIEREEEYPQPSVRAAIRRLRSNPPPPAEAVRIVHGDYRSGNLLHDGAGGLLAVLDWEMAHLGDPLEDLGWAFDPLWDHGMSGHACGTVPCDQAIAWWEEESGLAVDLKALAWWSLFNAVKGCGIWLGSAHAYRAGGCTNPVLGIAGWYTLRRHDVILSAALERFAGLAK